MIEVTMGPLSKRVVAVHTAFEPGRMFQDTMVRGPFARWVHTHRFEPEGDDACWLDDSVEYELPLGPLGALVAGAWVRRKLERMFDYRHEVTKRACERA